MCRRQNACSHEASSLGPCGRIKVALHRLGRWDCGWVSLPWEPECLDGSHDGEWIDSVDVVFCVFMWTPGRMVAISVAANGEPSKQINVTSKNQKTSVMGPNSLPDIHLLYNNLPEPWRSKRKWKDSRSYCHVKVQSSTLTKILSWDYWYQFDIADAQITEICSNPAALCFAICWRGFMSHIPAPSVDSLLVCASDSPGCLSPLHTHRYKTAVTFSNHSSVTFSALSPRSRLVPEQGEAEDHWCRWQHPWVEYEAVPLPGCSVPRGPRGNVCLPAPGPRWGWGKKWRGGILFVRW